jgi:hypothetical protein
MKILKFIAIIIIVALAFYGQSALAVKQVQFPDSSALQPMPAGVKPNISGNVNSHGNRIPSVNNGDENLSERQNPTDSNQEKPSQNLLPWIIFILSAGLLVFAAVIRKKKANESR